MQEVPGSIPGAPHHSAAPAMSRLLHGLRANRLVLPTVLLLLGGISYGSLFTANKIAIDAGFPFIAYSFWQALFASVVLLVLSAIFSKLPSLRWENLRVFALVAVFGFLSRAAAGGHLRRRQAAARSAHALRRADSGGDLHPHAGAQARPAALAQRRRRAARLRRDSPHRRSHRQPAGRGRLGVGAVLAADAARRRGQQCRGRPLLAGGRQRAGAVRRHDDGGRAPAARGDAGPGRVNPVGCHRRLALRPTPSHCPDGRRGRFPLACNR